MLYEVEGKESAIAGSRKIEHTDAFRFLDKAAICAEEDHLMKENHNANPWHICTIIQVEEVKRVMKMIPVWLCTILYSVVFTQMASLFVEQGAAMYSNVGSFHIPPASMSLFNILSVLAWIVIYNHALTPLLGRLTKNSKGLSDLQRMGVGLVIGTLAMVAAGMVETERLKRVPSEHEPSSLSILWQIPQYALVGASETFMYVVPLEFFNGQWIDEASMEFAKYKDGTYSMSKGEAQTRAKLEEKLERQ